MKAKNWLENATAALTKAGIGTARLDALVLLEDALGQERTIILAKPELLVPKLKLSKLNGQLKQRLDHQPLAYIRGKTEFYRREFELNKNVLEPRPESETMIDLLKQSLQTTNYKLQTTILDVGTGSGALAITAKLELPGTKVIATDIDPNCLKLARKNAKHHAVNIRFLKGDLLEPLSHIPYSLSPAAYTLLCNLPYVPDHYQINQAALMEPRLAIFGGPDGLGLYRRLFKQLSQFKRRPKLVFTESLPFQHVELTKIAAQQGFKLLKSADFIQVFH